VRALPCGDAAVLFELADLDAVLALADALAAAPPAGCLDVVPAARTVLVHFDPAVTDPAAVLAHLRGLPTGRSARRPGPIVVLPVTYDGPDLADVAALLGIAEDEVVARHLAARWTVAFTGFAPGFGYLVADGGLRVPRRPDARPRVPAGSVGLADAFSGVYPQASPGGWQLIGRTDARVWDVDRDPPALLTPGARVRFERAG
jgi:KipI family sensor histidine kinase inhibitor